MLDLILNQDDPERAFVKFKKGDQLVLLVNNQGGMSALEMGAVVDETLTQLGKCTRPVLLCGVDDAQRHKVSSPSASSTVHSWAL